MPEVDTGIYLITNLPTIQCNFINDIHEIAFSACAVTSIVYLCSR